MAEKRMFTQKIIDSDAFLDMPLSTQALYFHLNMRADDDGFVNNPKRIQRTVGASEDDLKLLIAKRFVIGFESGVIVIKHWRMHNTLKKDRYKATQYQEEYALLEVKPNNSYTEKVTEIPCTPSGNILEPPWNQTGTKPEPQYREEKNSIDQFSIGEREERTAEPVPVPKRNTPPTPKMYGTFNNVFLSNQELEDLKAEFPYKYEQYINKLSCYMAKHKKSYESHYATIKSWMIEDREKNPSSFDIDEFFELALRRSEREFAKMREDTRTVGNDEAVRARAEELKQKLS